MFSVIYGIRRLKNRVCVVTREIGESAAGIARHSGYLAEQTCAGES
jgi:hypothetical protein